MDTFLRCLRENAARIKSYERGHDGSDGTSDCVGFVIGALRLAGIKYKGVHGSNYFVRNCTSNLRQVSRADQIELGDVVYKAYSPEESGWDLPASYQKDSDQNDYYHIGVVTGVDPLVITHCSSGGMHYDGTIGRWKYSGRCTYVQKGECMNPPYIADVVTKSDALNIRSGPGTEYSVIGKAPKGASVTVKLHRSEWDFIEYTSMQGYVSNSYLHPVKEISGDPQPEPIPNPDDPTMIILEIPRATADRWSAVLLEILDALGQN